MSVHQNQQRQTMSDAVKSFALTTYTFRITFRYLWKLSLSSPHKKSCKFY